MLFNLVYAGVAMPAGIASDRLGRRNVIGVGFAVFAAVYVGFGLAGGEPKRSTSTTTTGSWIL